MAGEDRRSGRVDIRPVTEEQFDAFARSSGASFGYEARPEAREQTLAVFELERSLAVFDGEEIVGTGGIFTFDTSVPGGAALPTAGVTWISVKPTHRRRGILRQVMRRQLDDIRTRGEPMASLWASEAQIYGRFGYGLAAENAEIHIDRRHTQLEHLPPVAGRTRMVDRETALAAWPAIYDRARAVRPGMHTRTPAWWEHRVFREVDSAPPGFTGPLLVQFEEGGVPTGYVKYRRKMDEQHGAPAGSLAVGELLAATDAAYAGLWQYVFGVDLVVNIDARLRPVDEPLWWMLHDPRRLVREVHDALWVRILDVSATLGARHYATEGRLVIEVRDEFCPWTAGRYDLIGGPDGATCRPTSAEPDIRLGIAELGAAYLGGARFQALRRAGRVEGESAALRRADAMFAWDPLPWCPEVF
jgi:predicted acetyltransferase